LLKKRYLTASSVTGAAGQRGMRISTRSNLAAHLETRALLSQEQIARYDALRGYGGGAPPPGHDHHPHNG
jgi:hypothetical protein